MFISYLNTVHIDKAKSLLVETDMKAQNVVDAVDVENLDTSYPPVYAGRRYDAGTISCVE